MLNTKVYRLATADLCGKFEVEIKIERIKKVLLENQKLYSPVSEKGTLPKLDFPQQDGKILSVKVF